MNHETIIVTCMNVTIWEILGVDVTDNCKVVGQKLFYAFLSIHSSYRCAVKSAKGKICHSKIQTKRSFHSFVHWWCRLNVYFKSIKLDLHRGIVKGFKHLWFALQRILWSMHALFLSYTVLHKVFPFLEPILKNVIFSRIHLEYHI